MHALWMLLAALLFAVMGAFVKLAAARHGIAEIVFYRSLVGVAVLGVWVRWYGLTLRTPLAWLHLRRSTLGFLSLTLWFYSLSYLPLGTATTLNYTSSLFLALFAIGMAVALGRPLNRAFVGTIAAGFVGVLLVLRPSFSDGQTVPALVGLLSGLLSAVVYWHVRELGRADEPEWRTVFYSSLGGMLLGAAGMALTGATMPTPLDAVYLAGVGLSATLAQLAMTRAYGRGGTLLPATLQYATVPLSALLGLWLFAEPLPLASWIGIAVIVASSVLATWLAAARAATSAPRNAVRAAE